MNCAYCGRKRGPFETFTKHNFCPECNVRVRSFLKKSLARLREETPLCDPAAAGEHATSALLLERIDGLLALVEKLEAMRPDVPFFKSGTGEYERALRACRAKIEGGELPPPIAQADRALLTEEQKRAEFERTLAGLARVELDLTGEEEPRLPPVPMREVHCSRVLPVTNPSRIKNFVALNIQTTGLNPRRCEIIEISAVKFEQYRPVSMLSTVLVPRRAISQKTARETGITNDMVRGAPLPGEVIPALQRMTAGCCLVGYHLDFDLRFLCENGLDAAEPGRRFYDVYQTAEAALVCRPPRRLRAQEDGDLPYDVEDYSLESLCAYYDIPRGGQRRGGADCLAIGLLFERLARDIFDHAALRHGGEPEPEAPPERESPHPGGGAAEHLEQEAVE